MPNVPYTPYPTVTPPSAVPSDYLNIQATPADFGAQVGQAAERFGGVLGQAGQAESQQLLQNQALDNETYARDAGMKLAQGMSQSWADYRQKEGQAAYEGLPSFIQKLQDDRSAALDQMPNPMAKEMLANQSAYLVDRWQLTAGGYAADQRKAWMVQSHQANQLNAEDQAVQFRNQPDMVAKWAQTATDSVEQQGKLQGWDAATIAAQSAAARGRVYKNVIGTLAAEDPVAAVTMLNKIGNTIDAPTFMGLVRELKVKAGDTAAQNYVSGLMGQNPAGPPGTTPAALSQAIAAQEGSGTSPAGAVDGIMPATFKQYAQPGENFGNAADRATVRDRIVNDLWQKTGGDPARVAAGFFSGGGAPGVGLGNMSPAGSAQPFVHDAADVTGKTTSSYVRDVLSRLGSGSSGSDTASGSGATPSVYPDESALYQKALTDWSGNPEMQTKVLAQLSRQLSIVRTATATDRADLERSLPDLQAAALGGQDVTIPVDRMRRLLPPADAAQRIEQLEVAQSAGQVFKGVQWESPEKLQEAYQDLSTGLGPISTVIRGKVAGTLAGGSPGTASPDQDSPEAYRLRTSILREFQAQVGARELALKNDPAGYVVQNPLVAQSHAAIDPKNPPTFDKYASDSLAVQAQLGVAPGDRHILTAGEAAATSKQLMQADPATTDVGAQVDAMSNFYGKSWPKVFGDLVTLGKLPADYQVAGMMDAPGQGSARTDFVRALQASAKKGGLAQLEDDAPPAELKNIKQGLDAAIDPFRRTASIPGLSGNIGLVTTVRDSVEKLATYYAIQGMDGNEALQKAADGILNEKYDFGSSSLGPGARVPKGMLPAVESAAVVRLGQLKAGDLMPFRSAEPPVETPDYTGQFNTSLSAADEAKFQDWMKQRTASEGRDVSKDLFDYDLRGFWKSGAQLAGNGHGGDEWKKPNEPTFSTMSRYSDAAHPGGLWAQGEGGKWSFTASPYNLTMYGREDLQRTFAQQQQGATLNLPPSDYAAVDQQRASDALKQVQGSAQWAPNEDDSGLFAYVRMNDGRAVPVKMANGNRLELRFDSLPKAAPAQPPNVGMQPWPG